jgi:hypothetical protein
MMILVVTRDEDFQSNADVVVHGKAAEPNMFSHPSWRKQVYNSSMEKWFVYIWDTGGRSHVSSTPFISAQSTRPQGVRQRIHSQKKTHHSSTTNAYLSQFPSLFLPRLPSPAVVSVG